MSERETGQVKRDAVGRNQFFSEIFSRELSIKATRTDRIIELVRADWGLVSTSTATPTSRGRQPTSSVQIKHAFFERSSLSNRSRLLEKNTKDSRPLRVGAKAPVASHQPIVH